jgi:hypothetical protein
MRRKTTKIGAVLMTLVVLLSTMSFTMHMRFCGDNLVAKTLFLKSDSCNTDEPEDCCVIVEDCCKYEKIVISGQNELQSLTEVFSLFKKRFFVINLPKLFFEAIHIKSKRIILNNEYDPPNLVVNRQVILQVFII